MIDYFRTACVKNDVKKPVIVNFLDFLASKKAELCDLQEPRKMQKIDTGTKNAPKTAQKGDSLIETLEHQQKFELLIQKIFQSIQQHPKLIEQNIYRSQESRAELVQRITKILHCHDVEELDIDKNLLANLPE